MPADDDPTSPFAPGPPPSSWPARWILHPSARTEPAGVYHFRRAFDLPAKPASFRVRVSADQRFRLFVNGVSAAAGPARGDVQHWRYRTVDLASSLRAGRNVLAAVAWYLDDTLAPLTQMTHGPGFLLCGEDEATGGVNTPEGWKCFRNPAYTFVPISYRDVAGYYVAGPGEQIDAARYPWGWEQPKFDDAGWETPAHLDAASRRGARDAHSPWMLVPDLLPPMEETPYPETAIVRAEGIVVENHRLGPDAPITVPAGGRATLLFDHGHISTGYPELELEGGRGATIRLRYAEALVGGPRQNEKGNRNEIEGKVLRGYHDTFLPDGPRRTFRPLWWRTFRYLQVEVEAGPQPVVLRSLRDVFTAYPFQERGHFAGSDASLRPLWEVGWRTARLCAHETYMDCPYYEQLQYGGDTRIQCLVSYYVPGDHRLARNAIAQLDDSRLPDGITQSRYPSRLMQIIPPFSLWWVGMIHDYWRFVDEPEFVRSRLPGARATLEWFLRHLDPAGLLGPLPWWNFVDWTREFGNGVPPGAHEGESAILSLQLALSLREAAELEQTLGLPDNAARYRDQAGRLAASVRERCWSAASGLLADTPKQEQFSQHASALGILAGALPEGQERAVGEKLLSEPPERLAQATFYFRFYLHRALRHAGLGDHYLEWLAPWRRMLSLGLTTWAENPEPTRSDCHAWSAHPNIDLLATVLGVEPAAPGFSRVLVTPHLGPLEWADGVVPHPRGEVRVRLEREKAGVRARITLPPGIAGTYRLGGTERALHDGAQEI